MENLHYKLYLGNRYICNYNALDMCTINGYAVSA